MLVGELREDLGSGLIGWDSVFYQERSDLGMYLFCECIHSGNRIDLFESFG